MRRRRKAQGRVLLTLGIFVSLSFCIVFGAAPKLEAQPSVNLGGTLPPPTIPAGPRAYLPFVEGAGMVAPTIPSPTASATGTVTPVPTLPSPTPSGTASPTDTPEPTATPTPSRFRLELGGLKSYWGDLHHHSSYSSGGGRRGTGAPSVHYQDARDGGVDFLALTEYDAAFDGYQERWDSLGQIADAYNEDGVFLALRGFEWTRSWGHINVFNTDSYVTYMPLMDFYDWLASQPGSLADFNHPYKTTLEGYHWDQLDFAYHAAADEHVVTIESDPTYGEPPCRFECMYQAALYAGWHVGPVGYSDIHDPVGDPLTDSNKGYGIMAPNLTREDLFDALRARRTFMSMDDGDLAIAMRVNGVWMGSSVPWSDTLDFEIVAGDGSGDEIVEMELVRGGPCGIEVVETVQPYASEYTWRLSLPAAGGFYYARARLGRTQDTQEGTGLYLRAFTAPVWIGQQAYCPSWAEKMSIYAQADTYIESWHDGGEANYGSDWTMRVGYDGAKTALLMFDLAGIPEGATVTAAKLYLYSYHTYEEGQGPRSQYVSAYALRRSWAEDEATWMRASDAEAWVGPGCHDAADYDGRMMAVVDVRPKQAEHDIPFPYVLDLTSMVLSWVAVPESNQGLLLRACGGATEYSFVSSDCSTKSSMQPRLEIWYMP